MDAAGQDWLQALDHVIDTAKAYLDLYKENAVLPLFGLNVMVELLERYRAGERSEELYNSMLAVE